MRGQRSVKSSSSFCTHLNERHGIPARIYHQALASNTIDLLRAELGFTTILNQCGWCMGKFDNSRKLGAHRKKCDKKPAKFNDRLKKLSQERNISLPKTKPNPIITGPPKGVSH